MTSSILIIGGCSDREEAGALQSVEEITFQRTTTGLKAHSQIVGQLAEPRRSPAVLHDKDSFLVIGVFKMSFARLPDLPFRLKNGAAIALDDYNILLFGGWDESRTMKAVFRLQFDKERDSYETSMEAILPYEVEGHCCVSHDGYIYTIGGYNGVSVVDTIVRYSVADRESEILPIRLSMARENHVCEIVFGRYLVVMAGWDGKRALDSVEIFEIVDKYPYLVRVDVAIRLAQARNRPASITRL
ncbi:kelch repeat protein [Oesophagostomum dentatum]|uniref:Kelch repeat protein n=1 Tax=Oesophagostomum dentatum TaxID=61180 RepID=A0A0B1TMJ5_OESDE|nr:kelch repeat protein [Oesophagostomum dentatum]